MLCPLARQAPMTVLVPMRAEYFGRFSERTIAGYAHENVASFRWDMRGSVERAQAQFRALLPQGMHTPGHYFHEILDPAEGETVGGLWFAIAQASGAPSAHLYDLYIDPGFRREHHATRALEWLESRCRELGAVALELQMFAHNSTAHALYGALGYNVVSYNLAKRLDQV